MKWLLHNQQYLAIRQASVRTFLNSDLFFLGGLCRIAVENGQHPVPEIIDMQCGLIDNTSPDSKGTEKTVR